MKTWIARVVAWLKRAPALLLALAAAVLAVQAARKHRDKALAAARVRDLNPVPGLSPEELEQQVANHRKAMDRIESHADAAKQARQRADEAAKALETAGHPTVAESVRRWNRE